MTRQARVRAELVAARSSARDAPASIALDAPAAQPTPVIVHCRAGLERIVTEQLPAAFAPKPLGDDGGREGRVAATLRGAPERLLGARSMLRFGFPLPARPKATAVDALVHGLTSDAARRIVEPGHAARRATE